MIVHAFWVQEWVPERNVVGMSRCSCNSFKFRTQGRARLPFHAWSLGHCEQTLGAQRASTRTNGGAGLKQQNELFLVS